MFPKCTKHLKLYILNIFRIKCIARSVCIDINNLYTINIETNLEGQNEKCILKLLKYT